MVRHEVRSCCYCLKDSRLKPILSNQAAEAMGAISHPSSLPILKEYLVDSNRSVRETCEIAVSKIEWDNSEEGKKHHASLNESAVPYVIPYLHFSPLLIFFSLYTSVDPAPASSGLLFWTSNSGPSLAARIEQLQKELVDPSLPTISEIPCDVFSP